MSVYQHWDKLKTCMVGKSYPPEFFSWVKDSQARNAIEKIAYETEEDYQTFTKLLESFNVKVIRPEVSNDYTEYSYSHTGFLAPPMTPRDHGGKFGNKLIINSKYQSFINSRYPIIKDPSWPDIKCPEDLNKLNEWQMKELIEVHDAHPGMQNSMLDPFYKCLNDNNISYEENYSKFSTSTADVTRVGKDLYYPGDLGHTAGEVSKHYGDQYRINFYTGGGHSDGCFCPVVPGLIVSLQGYLVYKESFPDWEVIELPDQSWNKVKPFLELKKQNKGKWWVPGEEGNRALTAVVEEWLPNWVGYVEETVFDVNMLVVDKKNVIVNNYNKKVFDALERYGVTPHICNFRHRYFWDGGLHCISLDLEREGKMEDYFPERGQL